MIKLATLVLAISLTSCITSAPAYALQPCPSVTAHVIVHDYAGPLILDFCVDPNGFQLTGGLLTVVGGNPYTDGIFHNGFEE